MENMKLSIKQDGIGLFGKSTAANKGFASGGLKCKIQRQFFN